MLIRLLLVIIYMNSVYYSNEKDISREIIFIAQNVNVDEDLFLVFDNFNTEFVTMPFGLGLNTITSIIQNERKYNGFTMSVSPHIFLNIPHGISFWKLTCSLDEFQGLHRYTASKFNVLFWYLSNTTGDKKFRVPIFLWFDINDKNFNYESRELNKPNAVNLKIAKMVDGKPLTFALIVTNDLDRQIKFPDFFTADNQLKIKFPDGKIYTHPIIEKTEKLAIPAGESRFINFDLADFLTADKDFSLENFAYGLSELQWEVSKPDGEIMSEKFHLVKFNGELPAGSGWHLLAPPTPETFRDKLIEVLPPEVIEKK